MIDLISGMYFKFLSLFIWALILRRSAGTYKKSELKPPSAPLIKDTFVGDIVGYLYPSSRFDANVTR